MRAQSILETIGNTPHVRLSRMFPGRDVWLKLERSNPGGSIKDRIALSMIEEAEERGLLRPGTTIIEPTSGNTGIGLAMVAAVKGYRLILTMPDSMSVERRAIMRAYGAELVLTPRELGIKGSIARAQELAEKHPPAWIPMQFENPANPEVHRRTTAQEIMRDFPQGIGALVTGVGTGGHITGVGQALKAQWPSMRVLAVEPAKSPVLSGGTHTPHTIQGIGTGFVPQVLDTTVYDRVLQVTEEDARDYSRRAARMEGIFLGVSSGATLAAIAQALPSIETHGPVLGFCYDTGERYLSIEGLFQA
ncbi:MAG: cysteine synthase A [Phycisphaerales bacterium]